MKKIALSLIILFLYMSACTPAYSTIEKTAALTNTPGNLPQPTATFTAIPQSTLSLTPTATMDKFTKIDHTYLSRDGNWNANFYGLGILKLTVINNQNNLTWIYVDGKPQYFAEVYLHFISWSKDSRYLFFNHYISIDGFVPYYDGQGLKRLDTKTGEIIDIIPWNPTEENDFKIDVIGVSPSGQKIAYSAYQEKEHFIVIRNLDSGVEKQIPVSSNSGEFTWSADETRILFLQYSGDDWATFRTNVLIYDLVDDDFQVILSGDERIMRPLKWVDENTALFYEWEDKYYFLDVNTSELILQPDYEVK